MDLYMFLTVLFLLPFKCNCLEISSATNPVPTFDDLHILNISLSGSAYLGKDSVRGTINPNATWKVVLDTTDIHASFMIFQVHSYMQPLILSSTLTLVNGSKVNGTDIGLYSNVNSKYITFFIFNQNAAPVPLLLVPMLYGSDDPVPGGCNLSFEVSTAPFMTISYQYDNEIIQIDAQAASQDQTDCKPSGLIYDVYELHAKDTSVDSYFDAILSLATADSAKENGVLTRKPTQKPELRRHFASYPGLGSVYVVTVYSPLTGKSSAYVPIAKYKCIDGSYEGCYSYTHTVVILSIASLTFILAEVWYILDRNLTLLQRVVFVVSSAVTVVPALPSPLVYISIGLFICAILLACAMLWLAEYSEILRKLFGIFINQCFPLVVAHIFFGIALYSGLGTLSGFQDWLIITYTFGLFFLIFYMLLSIFRNLAVDELCAIFFHIALVSYTTNGILFYVYVDPSRILRTEFADVIFSPPYLIPDVVGFAVWPVLVVAYLYARRAVRRFVRGPEQSEVDVPHPYSHPYYGSF